MSGQPKQWIVVPRWDGPEGFQHYRDRRPKWIKLYTDLQHSDEWRELTGHQRAVLVGIWLEYASSACQLVLSTSSLSSRIGLRVSRATLETLNHAGFIHFSASKPLAQRYQNASLEKEREKEQPSVGASTRARASERIICAVSDSCLIIDRGAHTLHEHLTSVHGLSSVHAQAVADGDAVAIAEARG